TVAALRAARAARISTRRAPARRAARFTEADRRFAGVTAYAAAPGEGEGMIARDAVAGPDNGGIGAVAEGSLAATALLSGIADAERTAGAGAAALRPGYTGRVRAAVAPGGIAVHVHVADERLDDAQLVGARRHGGDQHVVSGAAALVARAKNGRIGVD